MMQRRTVIAALAGITLLTACGQGPSQGHAIPAGATVLALGDSLTAGVGAGKGEDWPSLLADLTQWNVVNAGVSGHTSAQGLERLPQLLNEHAPSLVIIGLGGNDFLRRQSAQSTQDNLSQAITLAKAQGAQVVLQAIPQPSLLAAAGAAPKDHPLYAALAKQHQVPLLEGLWGPILAQDKLRADAVHANAQGYAAFAQAQYQALQQLGLLSK